MDHENREGRTITRDGHRRSSQKSDGPYEEKHDAHENGKADTLHFSKKTLIIGGIVLGLILIAAVIYWLHARNFESTDDAYTTTHVHDISARVAGTVETVSVRDNQFVKSGQTLAVLDQRDFKVALELRGPFTTSR